MMIHHLSTDRRSVASFAKTLASEMQKVATNIVSAGRFLVVTDQNGRDTRERPRAGWHARLCRPPQKEVQQGKQQRINIMKLML